MAEAGMGIAETLCETAPRVCQVGQSVRQYATGIGTRWWGMDTTYLAWPSHREETRFLRHDCDEEVTT